MQVCQTTVGYFFQISAYLYCIPEEETLKYELSTNNERSEHVAKQSENMIMSASIPHIDLIFACFVLPAAFICSLAA